MSVTTWRGRQLEDLTYDELLLAQNQLLQSSQFYYQDEKRRGTKMVCAKLIITLF